MAHDTFSCLFYDRLVHDLPCEQVVPDPAPKPKPKPKPKPRPAPPPPEPGTVVFQAFCSHGRWVMSTGGQSLVLAVVPDRGKFTDMVSGVAFPGPHVDLDEIEWTFTPQGDGAVTTRGPLFEKAIRGPGATPEGPLELLRLGEEERLLHQLTFRHRAQEGTVWLDAYPSHEVRFDFDVTPIKKPVEDVLWVVEQVVELLTITDNYDARFLVDAEAFARFRWEEWAPDPAVAFFAYEIGLRADPIFGGDVNFKVSLGTLLEKMMKLAKLEGSDFIEKVNLENLSKKVYDIAAKIGLPDIADRLYEFLDSFGTLQGGWTVEGGANLVERRDAPDQPIGISRDAARDAGNVELEVRASLKVTEAAIQAILPWITGQLLEDFEFEIKIKMGARLSLGVYFDVEDEVVGLAGEVLFTGYTVTLSDTHIDVKGLDRRTIPGGVFDIIPPFSIPFSVEHDFG